ncbi:MAG: serine/threonine protein kinase [Myxococcales bacterium]|nr:serine/threonine protein kinase [Myxococcales bacterium]MCB9580142.1 serine/threonine protein kinase [Polyangiaceae bacterium]
MGILPTTYALVVAGVDLAVAALCWGWPKGELWPVETRFAGAAMATAALTTIFAAMLMGGIAPDISVRAFSALAILSFVAGTGAVLPPDAPNAEKKRTILALVGLVVTASVLLLLDTAPATSTRSGVPSRVLSFPSAVMFAVACGGFQLLEMLVVVRYWPRSHARSSLTVGLLVFVAGFIDMAALLGFAVPLIGAVTAAAIASSYVASRMLAQFRVALEGAEGRVPGFALQRFLGAGGMAEVFMAEAVGLLGEKRVAAVKRVRRDLVDDVELCAMFLDEARLAAELHHPNIVKVYSFGTGSQGSAVRPYIAMELVDGLPLSIVLRSSAVLNRPLSLGAITEIGVALCSALHYAHTLTGPDGELLGIVHRDVSPHNVLVSKGGQVKLIDFGIARARTREAHTKAGRMRGKLAYSAPEQISARPVDARTDIFSLGILLYEATALARPFQAEDESALVNAIVVGKHKKLAEVRPEAAALAEVIERAMHPDPAARWPDAQAFGDALKEALGEPLPGPALLADRVALVEAERSGLRELPSLRPPPVSTASESSTLTDSEVEGTVTVADPPFRT